MKYDQQKRQQQQGQKKKIKNLVYVFKEFNIQMSEAGNTQAQTTTMSRVDQAYTTWRCVSKRQ